MQKMLKSNNQSNLLKLKKMLMKIGNDTINRNICWSEYSEADLQTRGCEFAPKLFKREVIGSYPDDLPFESSDDYTIYSEVTNYRSSFSENAAVWGDSYKGLLNDKVSFYLVHSSVGESVGWDVYMGGDKFEPVFTTHEKPTDGLTEDISELIGHIKMSRNDAALSRNLASRIDEYINE